MPSRKAVFWKGIQEFTWLQICTIWTSILFKISKILWFQLLIFLPPRNLTPVYIFFWGGNHNTNRWKHISGPSFWENPPISFSASTSSTPWGAGKTTLMKDKNRYGGKMVLLDLELAIKDDMILHITCPFSLRWRLQEDSFDWWVK